MTRKRRPERVEGYPAIRDLAALGDGRALALVGLDGTVEWLATPTMASPPVLYSLLDLEGGRFELQPVEAFEANRRYLPRTNVLETTFTTAAGKLVVTDSLNLQDGGLLPWLELARLIVCVKGRVRLRWRLQPRFGFGQEETRLWWAAPKTAVASGKRDHLEVLSFDAGEPQLDGQVISGEVELDEGQQALLALVGVRDGPLPRPPREEIEVRCRATGAAWERWLEGHDYRGPYRAQVERSALALKLLTYAPSGAMMAAATTSLPERVGADANYDYRFVWIRDAAFTLDALASLGYREQVQESLTWLLEASESTHPRMEPFYTLEARLPRQEEDLPLAGWRQSRPVRVGNDAAGQAQLSNYGDLLETIYYYVRHGNALDPQTATRVAEVADFVCRVWGNDDCGIWELDEAQPYTHSKIGCWVALDRACRLAEAGQLPDDHCHQWQVTAEEIESYVETYCWSEAQRAYAFYAGSDELDASLLLGARNGYALRHPERFQQTVAAVRRELQQGPLVYRTSAKVGQEGGFLACSFWLVEALVAVDEPGEAQVLMDDLVTSSSDLGLYSEELAPDGEMLGNFPQALTHLSLIDAAVALAQGLPFQRTDEEQLERSKR